MDRVDYAINCTGIQYMDGSETASISDPKRGRWITRTGRLKMLLVLASRLELLGKKGLEIKNADDAYIYLSTD